MLKKRAVRKAVRRTSKAAAKSSKSKATHLHLLCRKAITKAKAKKKSLAIKRVKRLPASVLVKKPHLISFPAADATKIVHKDFGRAKVVYLSHAAINAGGLRVNVTTRKKEARVFNGRSLANKILELFGLDTLHAQPALA